MHELPITQGILDLVLTHAERAGGGAITDIHLVIGELSSVVDDSVQFYWDIISRDTPAEGAVLRFRRVPLQFECRDCNALFAPSGDAFECPSCAGDRVHVATGEDMRVEAIDVEPAATPAAGSPSREDADETVRRR